MVLRREVAAGFFVALICILILGGGFMIAAAEKDISAGVIPIPSITLTPTVTLILPTELPGDPTYTPSPSPTITMPSLDSTFLPPTCPVPSGWQQIIVNSGDTLIDLAQFYQTTVDALIEGNCLFVDQLPPGSTLFVPNFAPTDTPMPQMSGPCGVPPTGWELYTVKSGDTLFNLGKKYGGVSTAEIQAANCLSTTVIVTGQKIFLPDISAATPPLNLTITAPANPVLTETPLPSPPTLITRAATGITSEGASLNGIVNAYNSITTVNFEFGTDTYGTIVFADPSLVTGDVNTYVTIVLRDLMPNTVYHYRVVAENAAGITYGLDQTFSTTP